MYDFNQPSAQTTFADATELLWSNVARMADRGNNFTTARFCRRVVELQAPLFLKKNFKNERTLHRARVRWQHEKQAKNLAWRGRIISGLLGLKKVLKESKLTRLRQLRAYSMYRNQLKLALIRQAVVANVIKDKSILENPETEATRVNSEITSRLNRASRRLTLMYLLKRREARKAGRPFKQHILEFFAQHSRENRRKRLAAEAGHGDFSTRPTRKEKSK